MKNNAFAQILSKKDKGIYFYGTVPPRKSTPIVKMRKMAEDLIKEVEQLGVDGLVIYDVQDEAGRTGGERPYPFSPSLESEAYVTLLREFMTVPIECIVYHALPYHSREKFDDFLAKVHAAQCNAIVLVGGPSQHTQLSVIEAAEIVQKSHYSSICVGGITLPERHTSTGKEHLIVSEKTNTGLTFFTSQVVYNADNAITFLQDYDTLCRNEGKTPARIMFTFAPFGREETATFMRWLGVELPEGTKKRVLSKGVPIDCVSEAIQICRENLSRILNACAIYNIEIPLGFTCECVSKHREEIEGVSDLFEVLRDEMDLFYAKRRLSKSSARLAKRALGQSS